MIKDITLRSRNYNDKKSINYKNSCTRLDDNIKDTIEEAYR